jgi:hypothetical protein
VLFGGPVGCNLLAFSVGVGVGYNNSYRTPVS